MSYFEKKNKKEKQGDEQKTFGSSTELKADLMDPSSRNFVLTRTPKSLELITLQSKVKTKKGWDHQIKSKSRRIVLLT